MEVVLAAELPGVVVHAARHEMKLFKSGYLRFLVELPGMVGRYDLISRARYQENGDPDLWNALDGGPVVVENQTAHHPKQGEVVVGNVANAGEGVLHDDALHCCLDFLSKHDRHCAAKGASEEEYSLGVDFFMRPGKLEDRLGIKFQALLRRVTLAMTVPSIPYYEHIDPKLEVEISNELESVANVSSVLMEVYYGIAAFGHPLLNEPAFQAQAVTSRYSDIGIGHAFLPRVTKARGVALWVAECFARREGHIDHSVLNEVDSDKRKNQDADYHQDKHQQKLNQRYHQRAAHFNLLNTEQ